ncbi:prominin-1 isoform X3 [Xenopus tropicalis]|uniref:Prominin-1 isoform X3 n=1 Tax=Xenopus tropicalis TaxID=8364 RepID=A0A8J1JQX2_XENTR|nr:prominin-1 isoform X3 [Xenopus tropicalis]|eukprot:XP_017950125.1 PREDICTED: prominin-1 isoform X3 [Xenopus tropicalis]
MAFTLYLVFLLFCGCTVSERTLPLNSAPARLDFGYVPTESYETDAYHEPGAIGMLFQIVQGFLYIVQPHAFPQDLVRKVAQQKFGEIRNDYQKPENVVLTLQTIHYEIGFIIAAVLGLLFLLLMPLVGLCFCMCRCCDNCGGEMHQRQKKNGDCQRGCYATFLFVTTLLISVGVICAYAANQNLTNQIRGSKKLVQTNFKDLKTLLNDTPMQIDYVLSKFNVTKDKALSEMNNLGPLLGERVHERLGKDVRPAFDAVLNMAGVKVQRAIKAIKETKEALENVSVSVEVLQEAIDKLNINLTEAKLQLTSTLSDPACSANVAIIPCNKIANSLNQLNINANFSMLPDLTHNLIRLNEVLRTDLSNLVQKGYAAFNLTPEMVQNQTRNIEGAAIPHMKNVMESIGANITSFSKTIPVLQIMSNISNHITQSETYVREFYPVVEQYDFYRWLGSLVLCCMVALIVVFYYLGLLCGTCGYDQQTSPTTRGCISNTGGNFLMAGVGFSFIFSWILMLIVLVTFLAGGNVEKLVCEPFQERALFKVLDTPYLINSQWKNYLSGVLYQNPSVNLTFEKVYSDCKENKGIFTALQIDNLFNLNEFLNINMYIDEISSRIETLNLDLSNIILLDEKGKRNLEDFSSTGIDEIDFDAFLSEVAKSNTKVDLLAFANELEENADLLPKGALGNALKGHANSIRTIHIQQVVPLEQSMKYVKARTTLNQSIKLLQRTSFDIEGKVLDVITAVEAAQNLINNNASSVIKQESKKLMDEVIGYFIQYVQWVKDSIAFDVAGCKPVANVIDTAVDVFLCSYIVDSVNSFWFGLGGATVLLIPAIIFAIRLAKFYRRMDTEDVYDDTSVSGTWHFTL